MRTCDMLRIAEAYAARARRPVLARDVGRGDVRHGDAVPQGSRRGSGSTELRERSPEHPLPDAAAGRERRRLHELPRQRRQGVRQGVGRRPGSTCSASSTRSTGCRTCSSPSRRCATPARSARRPSATPATSSTRSATKYDLTYYVELAKELEKRGAHILAIKDMAGLLQAVRGRASWSRRCGRRSACRSTSTPTTSAGGQIASLPDGGRGGRRRRRLRDRVDVGPDLAAEPERDGRGAALHRRATPGMAFDDLQATADYWEAVRELLRAVRDGPDGRVGRGLPARDARRAVHEPVTSRRRRSASATAGTRSAGRTPRSTSCSATSSR